MFLLSFVKSLNDFRIITDKQLDLWVRRRAHQIDDKLDYSLPYNVTNPNYVNPCVRYETFDDYYSQILENIIEVIICQTCSVIPIC